MLPCPTAAENGYPVAGSSACNRGRLARAAATGVVIVLVTLAATVASQAFDMSQTHRGAATVLVRSAVSEVAVKEGSCSQNWENCLHTKCCVDPTHRCFQKDDNYAQCRMHCTLGLNTDEQLTGFYTPWTCKKLDLNDLARAKQLDSCARDLGDCTQSHCCQSLRSRCWYKDNSIALCNETCLERSNGGSAGWLCNLL